MVWQGWSILIAIGSVGAALAAIHRYVVRPMMRFARRLDTFLETWQGEPARPGMSPRPGIPERVSGLEESIEEVRRQLLPNGGRSMKDQLQRVEDAVADQARVTNEHAVKAANAEAQVWRAIAEIKHQGSP